MYRLKDTILCSEDGLLSRGVKIHSKVDLLPREIAGKIFGYLHRHDKFIYDLSVDQRTIRDLSREEEKNIREEKAEYEAYMKEIRERQRNYVYRIRSNYEFDDDFNVKEWDKIITKNKGKHKTQLKFKHYLRRYVNKLQEKVGYDDD